MVAVDSVEAVFGYTDSDKFFTDGEVITYNSILPVTQFVVYHRMIDKRGVIRAWEYSMDEAGLFQFVVSL